MWIDEYTISVSQKKDSITNIPPPPQKKKKKKKKKKTNKKQQQQQQQTNNIISLYITNNIYGFIQTTLNINTDLTQYENSTCCLEINKHMLRTLIDLMLLL